jgi:hypothetical protein
MPHYRDRRPLPRLAGKHLNHFFTLIAHVPPC